MLNTTQFPTMFGQNIDTYTDNNGFPSNSQQMPTPMTGDMTQDNLFPLESQYSNNSIPQNFANGGMVKRNPVGDNLSSTGKKQKHNPYVFMAEMIRSQGKGEDSILAHINPLEAMILKQMGGKGTINKKTGLPQFGFINKPGKALKSIIGGAGGSILGNMLLPGIGGVIGGALGQGVQHRSRGKSFGEGALKGGMMGAALPTAAGLAGSSIGSMGYENGGNLLSNYGNTNSVLPSLGMGGSSPLGGILSSSGKGIGATGSSAQMMPKGDTGNFTDTLMNNSKKFLSKPKNLLTAAAMTGSMLNKPKEKSPEKSAQEQKRYLQAMMLSPAERAALEADKLAERQMERRIARNQYLPEELFEPRPVYRRTNSPEEYKKTGKWLNYYGNPEFAGAPLPMKKGGQVSPMIFESEKIILTPSKGRFFNGTTKGQDDKIEADLSDGEVVVPADVVSHLGDGNSMAGGKEFEEFFKRVRKSKGMPNKLPPKAKSILNYMR